MVTKDQHPPLQSSDVGPDLLDPTHTAGPKHEGVCMGKVQRAADDVGLGFVEGLVRFAGFPYTSV